jgi:hypothetical protein
MRRLPVCPALLVTLLVFGGAPAEGQTASRFSVQASGLFVGVFGDAFEGVSSGGGFEVQARFNPSTFSIGLGYQASIHDLEFEDEFGGTQTVDLDFAGPFIEPRYVIDIGSSSAAPYLAARIAFLKQTAEADFGGTVVELESSGTQLNIGGGVLVRLSRSVNLDLGLTLGRIHFGEVEVTIPGFGSEVIDTGSSGDGQNAVLRVGVAIGLGG